MRKNLLLLFLLTGFALASRAQAPTTESSSTTPPAMMSIGIDVGSALSPANALYSTTTSLSFKFELPFRDPKAFFIISAAYTNYNTKNTAATDTMQNGHYLPLMIGFKYFVAKHVFVEGEIGDSYNLNTTYFGYQNAFAFSPAVGVSIPLNKPNTAVDISAYYQSRLSDSGNINEAAIRVAYKFGL
jgi:hypothetical protein